MGLYDWLDQLDWKSREFSEDALENVEHMMSCIADDRRRVKLGLFNRLNILSNWSINRKVFAGVRVLKIVVMFGASNRALKIKKMLAFGRNIIRMALGCVSGDK